MKNKKGIKNRSFFFLISFLFLTSLLSIKTLKKVDTQDIRISGSKLFSQNDVIKNSSINFPIRLIFVETNLLEKELKQNLSLKNVSVNRELFPFGLKVHINSRIPIAYGERVLNDEKILGFIDKDGILWVNYGNPQSSSLMILDKDGTGDAELRFYNAGSNKAKIALDSDEHLTFDVNGSERLRIKSDGKAVFQEEIETPQDYPNQRPALDFNFAQEKVLDPRLMFARDGEGSYYDEFGLVRLAGRNEPRFDHHPTTGASLGFLVE